MNSILVVWVPSQTSVDGRELRDFILESIASGVLPLTSDASLEVMELPPLGGVEVRKSVPESEKPDEEENVETISADEGAEKKNILQYLKEYRAAHGQGCLDLVAQKTSRKKEGRIPVETLRDIVAGNIPKMPLSEWRKISKALCSIEGVISISNE